jgi:hypothetical protein
MKHAFYSLYSKSFLAAYAPMGMGVLTLLGGYFTILKASKGFSSNASN